MSSKSRKRSSRASTSKLKDDSNAVQKIGNFQVLRIGTHCCYMRAHDGDDERTIFLVNLPVDTTDRHIKTLFSTAGAVESVQLWQPTKQHDEEEIDGAAATDGDNAAPPIVPLPPLDPRHPHHLLPTATSAHITFLDESSLQRALTITHVKSWPDPFKDIDEAQRQTDPTDQKKKKKSIRNAAEAAAAENIAAPPLGLDFLLARHRALRPPLEAVKAHADSVIANFEYRRAHPTAKKKAGIQAVSVGENGELLDEDGFVIVQSTGKYGRTAEGKQQAGSSVRVARRRIADMKPDPATQEKKRKRFELDDFYRFQRREEKREELATLRAKFKEDQEKVKKLKANRSFKPF